MFARRVGEKVIAAVVSAVIVYYLIQEIEKLTAPKA